MSRRGGLEPYTYDPATNPADSDGEGDSAGTDSEGEGDRCEVEGAGERVGARVGNSAMPDGGGVVLGSSTDDEGNTDHPEEKDRREAEQEAPVNAPSARGSPPAREHERAARPAQRAARPATDRCLVACPQPSSGIASIRQDAP